VLDAGQLVESGSYDELIDNGGPFANMIDSQAL
jgi:ABC-type multidrug transport system fused ATPase/permease subunit